MFMERSVVLWDKLQVVMKICGAVGEGKFSLERHMNRKFMVNVYQDSEI